MFEAITVLAAIPEAPTTPTTYAEIVGIITNLLGILLPVLTGLALLLFIWGIVLFLTAQGSEESVIVAKKRMFWGIIALFIIVSFWSILSLFFSDFFSGPFGIHFLPE